MVNMALQRKTWSAVTAGFVFAQLMAANPASAAEGDIGPVYIERVAVIGIASGGHNAGDFQIQIKGGFTVPTGMTCDSNFITTLKSVDADRRMLTMATTAQVTKQPVYLRITDVPAYTAFGGRCSLVWVNLASS